MTPNVLIEVSGEYDEWANNNNLNIKIITMRNIILPSLLAVSVSTVSFAAPPPQKWEAGFSGELAVLTGFSRNNSQFNTDYKKTDNLNSSGDTKNKFIIGPLGTLKYTFASEKKQLFIGNNRSDIALGHFNFEAGYRHLLDRNGVIAVSVLPGLVTSTTWADPFLTGQDRKETDSKVQAIRLKYDNILGSNFSLDLAGGKLKIDDENSGDSSNTLTTAEKNSLKRESKLFFGKVSHQYMLTPQLVLRSGVSYLKQNADGNAMSKNEYGAEAGIANISRDYTLALNFSYRNARFDETNPVFNAKQKDNRYRVNLAYSYDAPFGWTDWDFVAITGYTYNNSNIDFYDEKSLMMMAGLSFKF